jgi:hypothetical protein
MIKRPLFCANNAASLQMGKIGRFHLFTMILSLRSIAMHWVFGMAFLLASSFHANAQTVTAEASPREVKPNQAFSFSIIIEGANPQSIPNLRLPLQIVLAGQPSQSSEIQIVNNRQSMRVRFTWPLAATEPGDFVIAPQEVQVGGQILNTNEVKVQIKEGAQPEMKGNEPLLQISVEKTEFFQSEVVPIKAALYIHRSTNLRRIGLVEVAKSDFAIQRFPQQSEQSLEMIGDQAYYVLTFRSTLSALQTGKLDVGPASLEVLIDEPSQERSGFPPGFFLQAGEPRKYVVKSPAVPVTVLPLPAEGKPLNFTGAVGDFTLGATASPNSLTVGEPITVELSVTGVGNFDALTAPALINAQGWKTYPSRRYNTNGQPDANQPSSMERQIGFTQVLVPEGTHPEVPPFEMSFFSASARKYVTLRTPAIPVTIKPSAALPPGSADGAVGAAAPAASAPPPRKPEPELTNILEKMPAQSQWISEQGVSWLQRPLFWVINCAPLLLLMGVVGRLGYLRYQERKIHSPEYALQKIWQELHEEGVSEAEFYRRAAHFIRFTGVSNPPSAIQEIWERYEAANFAGSLEAEENPMNREKRSGVLAALAPLLSARPSVATSIMDRGAQQATVMLVALACCFITCRDALSASPDERYDEIVKTLQKQDYERAQTLTESLLAAGSLSPELFQAMAHARYRQGDFGRSVLWYERAALFDPFSTELKQNIRHLDEKLGYLNFPPATPTQTVGLLFLRNTWLLIASIGFWLLMIGLTGLIFYRLDSKPRQVGIVALIIGVVLLPLGAFGAWVRPDGSQRVKDIFVVIKEDAKAFTAASTTAGTVIDLPPGSQIRLQEKRGAWSYVEIPGVPDNLRGWVETDRLSVLWPQAWPVSLIP